MRRPSDQYKFDDADEVTISLQANTGARTIATAAPGFGRRDLTRGRAFRCLWKEGKAWIDFLDGKNRRFPGAKMYVVATGATASADMSTAGGTLVEVARGMGTSLSPQFATLLAELVGPEKVAALAKATSTTAAGDPEVEQEVESMMDEDPGMPEDVARYLAQRQARMRKEGREGRGAMRKEGVEPPTPADEKKAAAPFVPKEKSVVDDEPSAPVEKKTAPKAGKRKVAAPPKSGAITSKDIPKID